MKKKIISVFTAIMVFLIAISCSVSELGIRVSAADVSKKVLILGDSISTGYGLADASTQSFVAILDTANNIDLTNLAVNGDTSTGFLNKINNDPGIISAVQNSDIIMVSIGGNDVLGLLLNEIKTTLGLGASATAAEIQTALALPANQMALLTWANSLKTPEYNRTAYNNAASTFSTNFPSIVAKIKALNPNAQICFQTVYNPFNGTFAGNLPLLLTPVSAFTETVIPGMNTTINSGTASGYVVADTYTAFSGNAQTYTNIAGFDIHPNAAGHSKIAELITATSLNFTPKISVTDTLNDRIIYANGNPIIIVDKDGDNATDNDTMIYFDNSILGTYEDGIDTAVDLGVLKYANGNVTSGYKLRAYNIYGGSKSLSIPSTKITMLGGTFFSLMGGGDAPVTGSTNITIDGGIIRGFLIGGGDKGSAANTNITINGGQIDQDICGAGYIGSVSGNTNVTINGGTIKGCVYGGGFSDNVVGTALVRIGAEATVQGAVSAKSRNSQSVGAGSHVEYEVAFYDVKNGTKYTSGDYASQWITSGQTATEPTAPISAGEFFADWKNVVGDSIYNFSSPVTLATKLYPSWSAVPATHTVTYNDNGATGGTVPIDSKDYASGEPVALKSNTGNLTKTDYTFGGWSETQNGTAINSYTMGTTNVTFYAVWNAVSATHTVTYDGNGNTGGTVPTDINTYVSGAAVSLKGNTGNLTKTGFTFGGWSITPTGLALSSCTMGTTNVTLYAVWNAVSATHTVTYNDNGATGGTVPTDITTYVSGAAVSLKGNTGNLTKTGYTFGGWSITLNGSAISSYTMGTENTELYAKWIVSAPAPTPTPTAPPQITPTTTPTTTITDPTTGAIVDISGATFPAGVTSVSFNTGVMPTTGTDSKTFNVVTTLIGNDKALSNLKNLVVYDLKLVDQDGNVIKSFTGKVKVKIPVPAGMTGNIYVLWYDESTGKLQDMGAKVVDGYIEFETDHFSYYAIAQMAGLSAGASVTDNAKPITENEMPYAVIAFALAVGMVAFKQKKAKK